jgi:hypothetical protein
MQIGYRLPKSSRMLSYLVDITKFMKRKRRPTDEVNRSNSANFRARSRISEGLNRDRKVN